MGYKMVIIETTQVIVLVWSRDLRTSSLHAFEDGSPILTGAQCLTCPECLKSSISLVKSCQTPLICIFPAAGQGVLIRQTLGL